MLSNNSIRICVLHEKRPEPVSNKATSPGLPLFWARKRSFLYVTLVIAVMMSKIRRARLTASIGRSLKEQNFYLSAP